MASRLPHLLCMALILLSACKGDSPDALSVDLRTDLIPGLELAEVILVIEELDLTEVVSISSTDALDDGIRLARFAELSGRHIVEARFFDAAGNRIGQRRVIVRVNGETATTIVFTRSCLSVICPGEDPEATECLNGTCVSPECSPETPDACGDGFCFADSDCPAPPASCAASLCRAGACFDTEVEDACPEGQVCVPEDACVPSEPPPAIDLCPVLPPATGRVTRLGAGRAGEIPNLIANAEVGETFLFEAGTYALPAPLLIQTDGVTVRSEFDDADDVILDGQYTARSIFDIRANNVTLAHMTLHHATASAIHVEPRDVNIRGLRVYDVTSRDHGTWHVYAVPFTNDTLFYVDDSEVACSRFEVTDEGRPNISTDAGGCNTGGVRISGGQTWSIRDNDFKGFHCAGVGAPNPVIWTRRGARDVVIERNTILDSARFIGLGFFGEPRARTYVPNPYPDAEGLITDYDGLVRSNVIFSNLDIYDTGIEVSNARGARVLHNTVLSGEGVASPFASIDVRGEVTRAVLGNNLVRSLSTRNGGTFTTEGTNLEGATSDLFVDAILGDLHLQPGAALAIDAGEVLEQAGLDIDGQERDATPDLGADER